MLSAWQSTYTGHKSPLLQYYSCVYEIVERLATTARYPIQKGSYLLDCGVLEKTTRPKYYDFDYDYNCDFDSNYDFDCDCDCSYSNDERLRLRLRLQPLLYNICVVAVVFKPSTSNRRIYFRLLFCNFLFAYYLVLSCRFWDDLPRTPESPAVVCQGPHLPHHDAIKPGTSIELITDIMYTFPQ